MTSLLSFLFRFCLNYTRHSISQPFEFHNDVNVLILYNIFNSTSFTRFYTRWFRSRDTTGKDAITENACAKYLKLHKLNMRNISVKINLQFDRYFYCVIYEIRFKLLFSNLLHSPSFKNTNFHGITKFVVHGLLLFVKTLSREFL